MSIETEASHTELWPYINQLEGLLDTINANLLWFQEEATDNPKLAKQYFNTAHNLLGATQTVAAALAVKVGVRNELWPDDLEPSQEPDTSRIQTF